MQPKTGGHRRYRLHYTFLITCGILAKKLHDDIFTKAHVIDNASMNQWFSDSLNEEAKAFFFDGGPSEGMEEALCQMSLNVWDPDTTNERIRGRLEERKR